MALEMNNKGQAFVESLIFNLFFFPTIISFLLFIIQLQNRILIEDLIERYLICELYTIKIDCEIKFKYLAQQNDIKILNFKNKKNDSKIELFFTTENKFGKKISYKGELDQELINEK